jgi:LPS sulfotransferase NodH
MRTTFPDPQFVWLRRADKMRQGISWWRAAVTDQWGLRPGQEAEQPLLDVEQMVRLVQFAQRCEDGGQASLPSQLDQLPEGTSTILPNTREGL